MAAAGALRVLIVEDDFMVARVYKGFVERLSGFAVQGIAHTARQALALLEQQPVDVLLLDVYLPDRSGLQLLHELRRRRLPTDVILVTAARDVDTVREAMRGGALYYLVKPVQFDTFKQVLEEHARLRRRLSPGRQVEQAEVDQLYGRAQAGAAGPAVPKGLNPLTLERVVACLTGAPGPLTAEAVAAGTGVSRVTARRYLEFLAAQGRIRREVQYGAVGRPEHLYSTRA